MLDNQLIILVRQIILDNLTAVGLTGMPVLQAYQPRSQGVNTLPTAYLYKVGDRRIGSMRKESVYDLEQEKMVLTQLQQYETTFQLSALAAQDPAADPTTAKTASDILNLLAYIMQSETTVATLQAAGVGILRVGDIRNPYFVDDRDQNEAAPSFDFVLTHKQVIVSEAPIVITEEFQVLRV